MLYPKVYRLNHFQVYSSVTSNIVTLLCNQSPECSPFAKLTFHFHETSPLCPVPSRQPPFPFCLVDRIILGTPWEQLHTDLPLSDRRPSLSMIYILRAPPRGSTFQNVPPCSGRALSCCVSVQTVSPASPPEGRQGGMSRERSAS